MPSVLTEIGYLTNPLEETFLGSDKGQEHVAKALFRGIRKYKDEVEGNKKEYNDEFENITPIENENLKAGNSPVVKRESEEDSVEVEEKKTDSVIGIVENNEVKPIEKGVAQKEKVDDDKYTEIEIKKTDSVIPAEKATIEKKDTMVSAKSIADKFKKESETKGNKANETKTTTNQKQTSLRTDGEENKVVVKTDKNDLVIAAKKDEVVFKVQFASSDVALNLKQEKFSAITDADFYKAGNVLKYTSGKFVTVKDAVAHQTLLREKGFKDCFIIAVKNGQRIDIAEAKRLLGQ